MANYKHMQINCVKRSSSQLYYVYTKFFYVHCTIYEQDSTKTSSILNLFPIDALNSLNLPPSNMKVVYVYNHNQNQHIVFTKSESKQAFYIPFNSQGHIWTGPQHWHLWESNPHRGDSL